MAEFEPVPGGFGYGLRVENQLGDKMVKCIERVEFIPSEKELGKGEAGKNEGDEYFDLLPNNNCVVPKALVVYADA